MNSNSANKSWQTHKTKLSNFFMKNEKQKLFFKNNCPVTCVRFTTIMPKYYIIY